MSPLEMVGTAVTSRWSKPLKNKRAASEAPAFRRRIDRSSWVKQRIPRRPGRIGNKEAAAPIDQKRVEAKNAPTDPMRFLDGGVVEVPSLTSPDTKDSRLSSIKSANAIRTTPITSRLMCDGGEAAPRASPRLAEVLTAMIAMLAQGNDQFKQSGGRSSDGIRCFLCQASDDDSTKS